MLWEASRIEGFQLSAKVFVFGIDAMEPSLIFEWANDGTLPAFASLLKRGAWGEVINPPRRYSGGNWPNFYTGVGPDRHGQYVRTLLDEHDYSMKGYRPKEDRFPAFWLQEAWREKRVALVNVPYAPLHRGIRGLQVTNWGVHDYHDAHIQTWPDELAEEILSQFGGDPVGLCEIDNRTPAEFCRFRDHLIERTRAKRDMICKYLETREWDLFFSVLDESHCVSHQTWHFHDTEHPRHDPEVVRVVGNPIKDVYKGIDEALASVVERIDDTCTLIVVSSHGMGPISAGSIVLDEILRRIEGVSTGAGAQGITSVRRSIGLLPDWIQRLLKPLRERLSWHINEGLRRRDRRSRRYFAIETNGPEGGVRLNLAGRESQGLVQPGEDYEKVVARIEKELHQLVDGRSGKPLVGRVIRRQEINYDGFAGSPPDLVIEWAVHAPEWIESPTVGRLDPIYYNRLGDHRMKGFFVAAGVTIAPGQLNAPVRMEDFAPTIARMIGLPVGDTDGTPIAALVGNKEPKSAKIGTDR
jgi:predicted AlkP superfamily phosphohydrolase/phosphomutase